MHIAPDFVPRAALFVTPGGEVIPPASVVARLHQKSPRLGLRWMTGAHIPYWAVTQAWAPSDPRWAKVQSGEVPPNMAWDIAHMFPLSVTGEDMAAYIEQRWSEDAHRQTGGSAVKHADRIVEQSRSDTESVRESNVARATQNSLDRHERESCHALRVRAGAEKANTQVVVPRSL